MIGFAPLFTNGCSFSALRPMTPTGLPVASSFSTTMCPVFPVAPLTTYIGGPPFLRRAKCGGARRSMLRRWVHSSKRGAASARTPLVDLQRERAAQAGETIGGEFVILPELGLRVDFGIAGES